MKKKDKKMYVFVRHIYLSMFSIYIFPDEFFDTALECAKSDLEILINMVK